MNTYEFRVVEKRTGHVVATFDTLENASIFIDGYFNRYYLEENLCLVLEKRLKLDGEEDDGR